MKKTLNPQMYLLHMMLSAVYFCKLHLHHSYGSNQATNIVTGHPAGLFFSLPVSQEYRRGNRNGVVSSGCSFIEQPEILAIFGVMPLCLERKKGTVCRAGLDTRVQTKCFVAELLSREQKVARTVAVSFPLHQTDPFFSRPSGRPSLQLLNPCTRGEMRRPQLQVTGKNKKEKKPFQYQAPVLNHQYMFDETWSSVVKLSMPDLFRCV